MEKMTCWEFKKCGRDGANKANACPAYTTHNGHSCWRVAGTMCGGKVQGTFAEKYSNCMECDYYGYIKSNTMAPVKGVRPAFNRVSQNVDIRTNHS